MLAQKFTFIKKKQPETNDSELLMDESSLDSHRDVGKENKKPPTGLSKKKRIHVSEQRVSKKNYQLMIRPKQSKNIISTLMTSLQSPIKDEMAASFAKTTEHTT